VSRFVKFEEELSFSVPLSLFFYLIIIQHQLDHRDSRFTGLSRLGIRIFTVDLLFGRFGNMIFDIFQRATISSLERFFHVDTLLTINLFSREETDPDSRLDSDRRIF